MLDFTYRRWFAFWGVTLIVMGCYGPYVAYIYPALLLFYPRTSRFLLAVTTAWGSTIVVALFFAVFAEPGYAAGEAGAQLSADEIEELKAQGRAVKRRLEEARAQGQNTEAIYREQLGRTGYCFACEVVRPARTHHCKSCRRCVLRMDHHCPWTNNCVGLRNHAHFLRFLFHASTGIIFNFSLAASLIYAADYALIEKEHLMAGAMNVAVALVIGTAIGYLFGYQCRNVALNLTTIEEYVPGVRKAAPFRRPTPRENMEQVFGRGFTIWHLFVPGMERPSCEDVCGDSS